MAQIDAKFIADIESIVAPLFAPSITENQSVTCYVDEDMTPFFVLADNILTDSPAREAVLSTSVSDEHIQQKFFVLPDNCDTDKSIRVYIQGLLLPQGIYWQIASQDTLNAYVISWDGLLLEDLITQGDNLFINYWERM